MDSKNILDKELTATFNIPNEAQSFLLITCKWAKFLAILSFILIAGIILVGLGIAFYGHNVNGFKYILMLGYFLIGIIYYFPSRYLYRFSTLIKQGLENTSTNSIIEGFEQLKSFFKFWGVLFILTVVYYILLAIGEYIKFGGVSI